MNEDTSITEESDSRSWLEKLGHALTGGEPRNRQELLEFLRNCLDREILDRDTFQMLDGAIGVADSQVRDAMIPRGQMVCLQFDGTVEGLLKVIVESGHSRFPVISDGKDEVVGVLLAKDLLQFFVETGSKKFDLAQVMRPVVFIPESKRLNVLLKEFRSSRNHMAVVVDEYGGVTGLITIEDVLEEIVGEIDDEHDEEELALIRRRDDGSFVVDALTPIDQINEHFQAELSDEKFDTIGGLVIGELGRLPENGEAVTVGKLELEVLKSDSRRLSLLQIRSSD